MVTLNERQMSLFKVLTQNENFTTIKILSIKFEVSERTIRYDLQSISQLLKKNEKVSLLKVPRYGIKLEYDKGEDKKIILDTIQNEVKLYSQEERILHLALLLLAGDNTLEILSNKLEISKNTLVQDMKKVRIIFENLNIKIDSVAYVGIHLECSEENIRYAFITLFYKLKNIRYVAIEDILYTKNLINKDEIIKIIKNVEKELKIEYSENSYQELYLIITYVLFRNLSLNYINYDEKDIYKILALNEFKIIKKQFVHIDLKDNELYYIFKQFKSAKIMSFLYKNIKDTNNEIISIIILIAENIQECLGVSFIEDSEFMNTLVVHFNVAIYRLKNNFKILNPLTEHIKHRLGIIYQITEDVLKKYEKRLGIIFPDEEIAYMTMHFGASFEKNIKDEFRPKILIVCNTGLATAGLLNSKISIVLPQIKVIAVTRAASLETIIKKNTDVDFIVSTVRIKNIDCKVIEVNPLLNKKDIEILKDLTFNIIYEKSSIYLLKKYSINEKKDKNIIEIIKKSNIQFEKNIDNWEEAIKVASTPLLKNKQIEKEYIKEMIKIIKELGSYMVFIPEIAFVHATSKYVNKNDVSVIILKNRIYFGESKEVKVKAIVVLCNKCTNKNLIDITNILIKNDNIEKFKNAKKYDDLKLLI